MPFIYYRPILILFAISFGYYIVRHWNRLVSFTKLKNADSEKSDQYRRKDDAMEGLRNVALAMTPEQLGISLPIGKTTVYGLVMDFGMSGGVATIVCYQTGDASLYISTGGGIIGGGKYESVNNASKRFINLAQKYLDKASKTEITSLPLSGKVIFYLLTNEGIYSGQDEIKNFENNSSLWSEMFYEGNRVLAELRMAHE